MAWRSHGARARHLGRIGVLDCIRGTALIGMIVYHLAWDMHAFGIISSDPSTGAAWRVLGDGVATAFLALSGVGLTLARERGATSAAVVRRLVVIAAAAALVTVVTGAVAPGWAIDFGILHCIVVSNAVALALIRRRSAPILVAALAAACGPWLVRVPGSWPWIGVSGAVPVTLDFRPVLPWLAPVLLGMVAARVPRALGTWPQRNGAIFRGLAWGGRHSLAVYLLHQPALVVMLVLAGARPPPMQPAALLRTPEQAAAFLRECVSACAKGDDVSLCTSACHCALTATLGATHSVTPLDQLWQGSAADRAAAACRPVRPS